MIEEVMFQQKNAVFSVKILEIRGSAGRQPPHDDRRSDDSTKGDDDRRSDDSTKGALIYAKKK